MKSQWNVVGPPVNPHHFDEVRLAADQRLKAIELFDKQQADTRQRVDTLAKAILFSAVVL
jgi:hypothetical protein